MASAASNALGTAKARQIALGLLAIGQNVRAKYASK